MIVVLETLDGIIADYIENRIKFVNSYKKKNRKEKGFEIWLSDFEKGLISSHSTLSTILVFHYSFK